MKLDEERKRFLCICSKVTHLVVIQVQTRQIISRANFTIFQINTGSVDIRHVRSQEFSREKYHSPGPRNRVENFPLEMTCIMNFMREGEMIHDYGVRQSPDLAQN